MVINYDYLYFNTRCTEHALKGTLVQVYFASENEFPAIDTGIHFLETSTLQLMNWIIALHSYLDIKLQNLFKQRVL